jgi:hypothetical protein
MPFGAQEDLKNQVALRSPLQALLLNVSEKDFLLFSHVCDSQRESRLHSNI